MAEALHPRPLRRRPEESLKLKVQSSKLKVQSSMNYNRPYKNTSTVGIRLACAIVFVIFSVSWIHFFQADMLTVAQHVLSNGKTSYTPIVGTIVITIVLLLLQLIVYAFTRLSKRFHALTYVPSMFLLGLLTDIGLSQQPAISYQWRWWQPVVILVLWLPVVLVARLYQSVEENPKYSLFSRPMWINMLLMSLQIMLVVWMGNTNAVFHYRMKTECLLARGEYRAALEVGRKSLESDADLLMLRMYALARENALGERLFEYPITGTSQEMLPTSGKTYMLYCPEDSLYRFLGARPADPMDPMHYLDLLIRRANNTPDSLSTQTLNSQLSTLNYYLSGLLIDRQLDRFAQEIGKYYALDDQLPKHYREALVLYSHLRSHPVVVYHHAVTEEDWRTLQELERQYPDPSERKVKVAEQYHDTYWYYYEYEAEK